jgi:flagellar basal body L-ring protein FlgH
VKFSINTLFFIFTLALITSAKSASLWTDINIYTPAASVNAGDSVTVVVEDVSRLRYTLDVENTSSSSVSNTPDTTITGFLPAVSSSKDITHNDGVKVESRGTLSLRVGALIGAQQNDGTYIINGSRTYSFNGVATIISVSGRVNPVNMDGGTVNSNSVIDFQLIINTQTRGTTNLNLQRQLEEDATASTELTEEEKQQIITDYLQRMLEELSK